MYSFCGFSLFFDFLYFLSLDKSDILYDDSEELDSDSISSGMYYFCGFSLRFGDYVGSVSVLGSDIFAPTRVESKGNIFASGAFIPTGVKSKFGRLLEMFSAQIPYFISKL